MASSDTEKGAGKYLIGVAASILLLLVVAAPTYWMNASMGTVEKTARTHTDEKTDKLAGKLAPFREQIEMSRFLAELKTDAETGVGSLEELKANPPLASLAMYLGELGFASLVKRLLAKDEPARKDPPARGRRPQRGDEGRPSSAQGSIF